MNKKKSNNITSFVAAISVFTTFAFLIVAVIYSVSAYTNKTVLIILWILFAVSAITFIISIVKFALGNPRLKNK